MAARRQSNKESLKAYKQELTSVRHQMEQLSVRHSALTSIVRGLEQLEGVERTNSGESQKHAPVVKGTEAAAQQTPGGSTIISAAVNVLGQLPRPKNLGTAAIRALLAKAGRNVSYATLFVALNRESAKHAGLLYKSAKKFGLREWKEKQGT